MRILSYKIAFMFRKSSHIIFNKFKNKFCFFLSFFCLRGLIEHFNFHFFRFPFSHPFGVVWPQKLWHSSDLHCTWKRSTKLQGVLHAESNVTCASHRYVWTCHKCGLTGGHLPDTSAGLYFYQMNVPDSDFTRRKCQTHRTIFFA